jgi:hypothetical protein
MKHLLKPELGRRSAQALYEVFYKEHADDVVKAGGSLSMYGTFSSRCAMAGSPSQPSPSEARVMPS